ncbi:MAG: hypothetical protein JOY71_23515, partial [Acetobacteraceae bacterium]|nr:hypothetical protein [Acetobacteraceae bacterium]
SSKSRKHDDAETLATWNRIVAARPTNIGAGSIFFHARRHGWVRPPPKMFAYGADERGESFAESSGAGTEAEPEAEAPSEEAPEKPVIVVSPGRVHVLATEGEDALRASGLPIFQRGEYMVQPMCWEVDASDKRKTLATGLKRIKPAGMIDLLSQAAEWGRYDGKAKQLRPCDPPRLVSEVILSRSGSWKVPSVSGIVTTPTIRPDGSILAQPGYDPQTRLYYIRDPNLVVPEISPEPTREAAESALRLLDGLLTEFPFVTDTDRAVALSGIVTAVVRGAFTVAPLHAFRAPTAGTGKSFLVDVASVIATGQVCPVVAAPRNEDELEKRLAALLIAGVPCVSIDNVNGVLASDLLCQATERPLVWVRKLGLSEMMLIESRASFFATGNALRMYGDLTRRTLPGDLDAQMERPEERVFPFNPVKRVLSDRGQYVAAALTVVRAYLAAGSPDLLPPLASYEDWSGLVRSPLVWLGCADPVQSIQAARDDDPELATLRQVLVLWRECFADDRMTARQVADAVSGLRADVPSNEALRELRNILADGNVAGGRGGAVDSVRLGLWLRKYKDRIVGDLKLVEQGRQQGGAMSWAVIEVRR